MRCDLVAVRSSRHSNCRVRIFVNLDAGPSKLCRAAKQDGSCSPDGLSTYLPPACGILHWDMASMLGLWQGLTWTVLESVMETR